MKRIASRIIVLIATALFFVSCGEEKQMSTKKSYKEDKIQSEKSEEEFRKTEDYKKMAPTTSYTYKIVGKKEVKFRLPRPYYQEMTKVTYTVDIESELSKVALDEIADVIKYSDPNEYVFVEYYLPTQSKYGTNYGISKRTPSERISQINYIAPPKEKDSNVGKKPYDDCLVFGKWNMIGAVVIAYQKGNVCYMVNYYGDSNYGEPEIYIKRYLDGFTVFENAEDPSDVYVINENGDLDGYYEGDFVVTFPKSLKD